MPDDGEYHPTTRVCTATRSAARRPASRCRGLRRARRLQRWSHVDVVVVADGLPKRRLERLELLIDGRPPRVEPIGFTPAELIEARRRGSPLVAELDSIGIPVL